MKIFIVYTFLMASGVTIESEPMRPTVNGRPVHTMEACEQYAAESVKRMRETAQVAPMFDDVWARCVVDSKGVKQ